MRMLPSVEKHRSLDRRRSGSLCINAIRMLSIDAVQQANSGHPGYAVGRAYFRLDAEALIETAKRTIGMNRC
jgi:hypothetical protein